jgi:hypothetical protein
MLGRFIYFGYTFIEKLGSLITKIWLARRSGVASLNNILWTLGKSALLDIGITNPTCQTNIKKSATTPGHALDKYESAKLLRK